MSLHYDESRPSPLQRQYAAERRAIRSRIENKAIETSIERVKKAPVVFVPTTSEIIASVIVPEALGSRDWLVVLTEQYRKKSFPPGIIVKIIAKTARKLKRLPMDIKSHRRSKYYFIPRHCAMFLCREKTEFSLPEIGRKFGGFDHSSILNGVRKTFPRMRMDAELCQNIAELEIEIDEYIAQWRGTVEKNSGEGERCSVSGVRESSGDQMAGEITNTGSGSSSREIAYSGRE